MCEKNEQPKNTEPLASEMYADLKRPGKQNGAGCRPDEDAANRKPGTDRQTDDTAKSSVPAVCRSEQGENPGAGRTGTRN